MKILMLANELRYTCGVTNHLLHLCKSITESSYIEIYIICGSGNGIDRFNNIKAKIICNENFLHSSRNILKYLNAIKYLKDFIKSENINIIHSHYHYGASIAKKAAIGLNVKTIQTNHGIINTKGVLRKFNSDYYIAINEHIYNYIVENNITSENNIRLIRCGIPVNENFTEKPTERKLKVISSGRFVKEKGFDTYIKAVNALPDEIFSKAEFYISGTGELENYLKELNIKSGSKVNFAGNINNLSKYLSSVHIFVNCSVSDSEGFPAVITEAGSEGCILLSSNFKGHEYILQNGINSIIYSRGNEEELNDKLREVILNYDSYKGCAKSLYDLIKKEYSLKQMTEKHIELYEQCLKQ